jgi:hypothetical protein
MGLVPYAMNTKNAFGLMAVGVLMRVVPMWIPTWFPSNGPDGSNASALWLMCMGTIMGAIGGWHVLRHNILPALMRMAVYRPHAQRQRATKEVFAASRRTA